MIDIRATDLVFQPLQFSRNRLEVLIDPADPALTDRSGLRYALTLHVPEFPQSPNLVELTTLQGRERPPKTTGGVVQYEGAPFRIDAVLDGFLESQKPSPDQTAMSAIATLTMPYSRTEAVSGGTPAVDTQLTRDRQWVFRGGLSRADFAGWGNRFFDQYLASTRQFLTWQPPVKTIAADQPDYLYFLLNFLPTPTTLQRRVLVTFPDGHQQLLTRGTLTGASLNQVVCVPAGPPALELPAQVVRYQVWLSNQNDRRLSQVRTYQLDTRARASQRFILFENSLSGFDTLRLLGSLEEKETVSRLTVATDAFGATAIDFSSLRIVQTETAHTLTVSTGYFEHDAPVWNRYLSELLLSRAVYLVTDQGHVPLTLLTSERTAHDDDADLQACTLVFQKSNPEQSFSQLPAAPVVATRPTAWQGVGIMHVLDAYGKRTGYARPIRLRKIYQDDGSVFKPLTEKPNTPGDPDYQDKQPLVGIEPGSTPYPSAGISRAGSYKRTTCPSGQVGGPATIVVPAGRYGGEAAGEADARAEAEFRSLDTPAYANTYGSCTVESEHYSWEVPPGHWHYRTNQPGRIGIVHWGGPMGVPNIGNSWDVQGENRPYCFLPGTNDLDFPPLDQYWHAFLTGPANGSVGLKIYRNGTLVRDDSIGLNQEGGNVIILNITPAAGDKYYFQLQ